MHIIIPLLIIGSILDGFFILSHYKKRYGYLLLFKTVSSLFFVLIGIVGAYINHVEVMKWLIVVGLFFGVLGDFFLDASPVYKQLEKNGFLIGFGAFFVGHVLYIVVNMREVILSGHWMPILIAFLGCVVGAIVIKLMFRVCSPSKEMTVIGIAYLLVLDFSCFLAMGLWMNGIGNVWMAFGTLLFMVSDHMIVYDYFGNKKIAWFHGVLLVLYYAGQCMIACSLLG